MTNSLSNIVEESVKKVLKEYMGVSDDILSMGNEAMQLLLQQYRENQIKELQAPIRINNGYTITSFKLFTLYTEGSELNNYCSLYFKLYLFDPDKISYEEIYEALLERGFIKCDFSPGKNVIRMFIPWPYTNQLDNKQYQSVFGTLNHELKHAFQNAKRGGTNISAAYSNANIRQANRPTNEDSTYWLIEQYIPWVFYMFDFDEVDAHIQQVYSTALVNNDDNINDNKTLKKIYSHISEYNFLKKCWEEKSPYYKEKNTREYIEKFITDNLDITAKRYFDVCERGLNRYRKCLMRILARWQSEGEGRDVTGNQGSFKQYASGEIENGSPFIKQNPSKKNPYIIKLMRLFKII